VLAKAAKGQRLRQGMLVAVSGVLAIALCAVYLLPMQLNQSFINPERFIIEKGSYSEHFWMPHSLFGFLCFILPLLGLYFEQPKQAVRHAPKSVVRYWVLILVVLMFLVSPASRWLWDRVTPLHYMQFPMRFYTGMWPAAVFLALLWLPQAKTRGIYPFLLGAMLLNVTLSSWDTWFSHNAPPKEATTMVGMNNNPEYFSRWVEEPLPTGVFNAANAKASMVEGKGNVSVLQWSAEKISVRADILSDRGRVVLHQFYYPYWQSPDFKVEPYRGFVSVVLPKGVHEVNVVGSQLQGERSGSLISFATALVLVLWQIILVYKRRGTPAIRQKD
jgi:hypothetical protein